MYDLDALLSELMALRPARHSVDVALLTVYAPLSRPKIRWALSVYSPHSTPASRLVIEDLAREVGESADAVLTWTRGEAFAVGDDAHVHLRSWTIYTDSEELPTLLHTDGLAPLLDALASSTEASRYEAVCRAHPYAPSEWSEWLKGAQLVRLA